MYKSFTLLLFMLCLCLHGQDKTYVKPDLNGPLITESCNRNAFIASVVIDEIILHPDFTFQFNSRPMASRYLWQEYKGTYHKSGDTIIFRERFLLNDVAIKFTSEFDQADENFTLSFTADTTQVLKNKEIKISYIYDFDTEIKDSDTVVTTDAHGVVVIPFAKVKNVKDLASLRIALSVNNKLVSCYYPTVGLPFIKRKGLFNKINVNILLNPTEEATTRITKGVLKPYNCISIISSHSDNQKVDNYKPILQFAKLYAWAPN